MKMKKEIADLSMRANITPFPKSQDRGAFARYRSELGDVLRENFGYLDMGKFEWDDLEGEFYWDEKQCIGRMGSTFVWVEFRYKLSPRKSLSEEIDRLLIDREAQYATRSAMRKAITEVGGEVL